MEPSNNEFSVSINVQLSENLVQQAKVFGNIKHRSVPKQIEYWSQIGKLAQEIQT